MTKKSLLDAAQSISLHNGHKLEYSNEELELVQGWLDGIVGVTHVAKVLNQKGTGNVYAFLARGAKKLYQDSK